MAIPGAVVALTLALSFKPDFFFDCATAWVRSVAALIVGFEVDAATDVEEVDFLVC